MPAVAHSNAELASIAASLGFSAESAAEMIAEHLARREPPPRYVVAGLNAALSVNGGEYFQIANRKVQRFLDRKFGFAGGVEQIASFKVARHRLGGEWIVLAD